MLEKKIESILFFKNEPVALAELSKILNVSRENLQFTIYNLQKEYQKKGFVIVTDGEYVTLGTNPENSELIEQVAKDELSREIGRAGLETLAIVLYRSPVSRREIDQIRGVNSGFILRNLMIRGLVDRTEDGRSFTYKPTLKFLEHLGVTSKEELPEYKTAFNKIEEFMKEDATEE